MNHVVSVVRTTEDKGRPKKTKVNQTSGGLTHGHGMEMMTSVSSNSDCSNSYSMFTSHLPAFSDGQQLTGREREGGGGRKYIRCKLNDKQITECRKLRENMRCAEAKGRCPLILHTATLSSQSPRWGASQPEITPPPVITHSLSHTHTLTLDWNAITYIRDQVSRLPHACSQLDRVCSRPCYSPHPLISYCHCCGGVCPVHRPVHMHRCMQINTDSKHREVGTSPSTTWTHTHTHTVEALLITLYHNNIHTEAQHDTEYIMYTYKHMYYGGLLHSMRHNYGVY